jgi:hypothetical protein
LTSATALLLIISASYIHVLVAGSSVDHELVVLAASVHDPADPFPSGQGAAVAI